MGGGRRPRVGGLVGGRRRALQVVGLRGHVCVLRRSALGGRCQALVRGRDSVLTDSRTLEAHGGGLQGLPASRGLLRGLEQTLVSPLADWSFVRPLLRPVGPHWWTTLWPHAGIHLPCIRGHVVGLLVLRVWGRQRDLRSSLGHSIGLRLQGWVPCNLWGSS